MWIGALSPKRKMLSVQLDYFVERTVPVGVKALLTNREPPEALFATYTIKSGKIADSKISGYGALVV